MGYRLFPVDEDDAISVSEAVSRLKNEFRFVVVSKREAIKHLDRRIELNNKRIRENNIHWDLGRLRQENVEIEEQKSEAVFVIVSDSAISDSAPPTDAYFSALFTNPLTEVFILSRNSNHERLAFPLIERTRDALEYDMEVV